VILEWPALERILRGPEPLATDLCFSSPLVRDARLAQRFTELHLALETRRGRWSATRCSPTG
jgi:hypothetical protein